ncbi:MAG: hypothetical protein K2K97_08890 [Muribaculaceae bacterium]|nr:hypothetical protein [Muribaculaceae bacterium]
MKRIIVLIFLLACILPVSAREPRRGYRGFIDIDMGVGLLKEYGEDKDDDFKFPLFAAGISTSHGFQINNNWFAGAGFMLQPYLNFFGGNFPIFAEGRFDKKWGNFTPFADARLGYILDDGSGGGVYFSPTVGIRINFGKKVNLNVGMGMSLRSSAYTEREYYYDPDAAVTVSNQHTDFYNRTMFTFRFGIDF